MPIYLHPSRPHPFALKAYFSGYDELLGAPWGFSMDTGAHYLRLVFAGIYDAFPDLKIILGHNGECLPFVSERINAYSGMDAVHRGLKKSPLQYLRENLIITTSGNLSAASFMCAYLELGADRILFSVDWPFESNLRAAKFFHSLPISAADKEKIGYLNAKRLLGI